MLHERWCAAGYDPDAFWHQTPRTFHAAMRGALSRARIEARTHERIALNAAYQTAVLIRTEDLKAQMERFEAALTRQVAPPVGKRPSLLAQLSAIAKRTGGAREAAS